ncbi:MAG TPA: CoA ester lyase [Casimicrobiaceae bacterium]|jgi:citrate lyase subunit beta/citryl-CoA lyase
MPIDYRLLRSWLFVPGDSERKLARAWTAGADALIVDLEDAVAGGRKAAARDIAAAAITAASRGKLAVAIRINAIDTGLADDDIAQTFRCRPDAYVLPKASDPADIRHVAARLGALESEQGVSLGSTAIVPIVTEHPCAIPRLESLCTADPRVLAIMCGNEDLAAAIGSRRIKDESGAMLEVFRVVRALALLAGSAAGVGIVDSPVIELAATDVLEREAGDAAAMGFTGKLAIHPAQLGPINDAFLPTASEIGHAQSMLDAAKGHDGAFRFEDRMVDVPHLRRAERIMALARAHGLA